MRLFLFRLTLIFAAGLAFAWIWGLDHRLFYLSRDYALLTGKERLIDRYAMPGVALFGDSAVMDGVLPERLGPGVINCAMNGSTPIESYFLVKRFLKAPALPKAVLISYSAYHLGPSGLLLGKLGEIRPGRGRGRRRGPGEHFQTGGQGTHTPRRVWEAWKNGSIRFFFRAVFHPIMSRPFSRRAGVCGKKRMKRPWRSSPSTRGQYYFPLADGSKALNADTKLKAFTVSPVIDFYFLKTLELLQKENIPVYFYAMPINESSVPHLDPGVFKAYGDYLEGLARQYPGFHILEPLRAVYPWTLFSDQAHLNQKGTLRFNREFAQILNRARIPGGPYGVPHPIRRN